MTAENIKMNTGFCKNFHFHQISHLSPDLYAGSLSFTDGADLSSRSVYKKYASVIPFALC